MRDPSPIGGALASLAGEWGMEHPMHSAMLLRSWERIVGKEVAARCRPTSLRGGVLRVRTDSAVWASEFRYLAAEVARRINAAAGQQIVKEVKPWLGPPPKEKGDRKGSRLADGAPPRQPPGPAALREGSRLAEGVPDEKMAQAFRKAFLAASSRR
ncbi:MAG: DciA family protein [Actinomycetota bacterium]